MSYIFRDPTVLLLLFILPLLALVMMMRKKGESSFVFSSRDLLEDLKPTARIRLNKIPALIRLLVLALFILALARPQSVTEGTKTVSEGVDIVLVLDTSTSMLAEDFTIGRTRINRYDVVKEVVKDFVKKRKDDRI
nr:BatA domain-containing protein [Candidatus Omnitrophota bacterium]